MFNEEDPFPFQPLECPDCEERFPDPDDLYDHLQKMHSYTEKDAAQEVWGR